MVFLEKNPVAVDGFPVGNICPGISEQPELWRNKSILKQSLSPLSVIRANAFPGYLRLC